MTDPVVEISEALQRHVDGEPPRVNKPAEVILQYDLLLKQGATESTWNDLVKYLRLGGIINPPKTYAVAGHFSVKQAMARPITDDVLSELPGHKLIQALSGWAEILAFETTALVVDFLEEDTIPLKSRMAILGGTGLQYSTDTGALVDADENEVTLNPSSRLFVKIFGNLVEQLGNSRLADGEMQKVLGENLGIFLVIYLRQSSDHFKEHFDNVMDAISKLGPRQLDEFDMPVAGTDEALKANLKTIYTSARELILFGLPDYSLPTTLVEACRDILLAPLTSPTEVLAKLSEWGIDVPSGVNLSEFIADYLARVDQQIPQLFRERKRKEGQALTLQRKYLRSVDLKAHDAISSVQSWPQLLAAASGSLQRAPHALSRLSKVWDNLRTQLVSYGKYFSTQIVDGDPIEIHMLPAKGLPAAVAVDTGSDCGKGEATGRVAIEEYTVFAVTDESHTKPWGYHGLYDVIADGALWLMIDALNPSTQLDIDGEGFIDGVRKHLNMVSAAARQSGITIRDFLTSASAHLLSNREPLTRIHPTGPAIDLPQPIETIPKALNSLFEIVTHVENSKTTGESSLFNSPGWRVARDSLRSFFQTPQMSLLMDHMRKMVYYGILEHDRRARLDNDLEGTEVEDDLGFTIFDTVSDEDYARVVGPTISPAISERTKEIDLVGDHEILERALELKTYFDAFKALSGAKNNQELDTALRELLDLNQEVDQEAMRDTPWWVDYNVSELIGLEWVMALQNYLEDKTGMHLDQRGHKEIHELDNLLRRFFPENVSEPEYDLRQSDPAEAIHFTEPE